MKIALEALFLLLTFLDLEFSKRKIAEYGIDVELNPAIKWLIKKTNIDWGVTLGVLIPTSGLVVAGWYFPMILAFMLGVRSLLFLLQYKTR